MGSVGDEAAKLLGALSDWARDQGTDYAGSAAGAAGAFASAVQDVNEHVATGGEDCRYCPVCQVIHVVRQTSPEVREHLSVAASSLLQAAAGLLATNTGPAPEVLDGREDRPGRRCRLGRGPVSYTVGVDVGGTKIAAGLVDERGHADRPGPHGVARHRPRRDRADHRQAGAFARRVPRGGGGRGLRGGLRRQAARDRWSSRPTSRGATSRCKERLQEELHLPVVVENDANAAAWGEFTFGAGEDVEDLLMLTIGTGVGGGRRHRRRAGAWGLRDGWRGRPHPDGARTGSSAGAATSAAWSPTARGARWCG